MKIRQSISPVFCVVICLCVRIWSGSVAEATTYYVAKTGKNQNSCAQAKSQNTPKATINAGLECLRSGDTLTVGAGTYTESLTRIPSNVTVKAMTPKAVTLKPSGTLRVVDFFERSHNITLEGLVLDGSNVTNTPVKIRTSSTGITLRNGVVKNTRAGAACIHVVYGTSDIVLSNLEIYNCRSSSTSPGRHGIYWQASDGRIENCRLHGFSGFGIQFYRADNSRINGNIFRGNTIYDAHRAGIYVGSSATENLISDNTIYDVYGGINVRGHHNKIVNNDVDSTMCAINLLGSNNIVTGNTVSSNGRSPICNSTLSNSIFNNTAN